jgi:hypothetical protein
MHIECLAPQTKKVLARLAPMVISYRCTLAGGTALALHLGHRLSQDFDFFTPQSFSSDKIIQKLRDLKLKTEIQQQSKDTFLGFVNGVKCSVFKYPYPFLDQKSECMKVPVAGLLDIAAMKVIAICQRGTKRDFVDLYFILQKIPFKKIAENIIQKYGAESVNSLMVGKALVYFDDAENDPDPFYTGEHRPSWKTVKKFFVKNVRQLVLDLETV